MPAKTKDNHELLFEFINATPGQTIAVFGENLKPTVEKRSIWRWCCRSGKPSGPSGYLHRKQIEEITNGIVLADKWD